MPEIIHEIAQIQLPQELLNQVNFPDLINKFKSNFKKLGNLKNIREKHEARGFFKKIYDVITFDDTLENAQLDAAEVQAAFSESIGQLLVFSIVQSQHLEKQQVMLSEQQNVIMRQTASIEHHNGLLEKQHEDLADKSVEIKELVDNFVALKGFTHSEVKKLLDIAQKVEGTEVQLRQLVEQSLADTLRLIGETEEQIKAELAKTMELVGSTIFDAQAEIDKKLSAQLADVIGQLASSNEKMLSVQDDLKLAKVDSVKQHDQVAAAFVLVESKFSAQLDAVSSGMDIKLDAIAKQFEAYQSYAQVKFRRLHIILGASTTLTVGLLGFIVFRM